MGGNETDLRSASDRPIRSKADLAVELRRLLLAREHKLGKSIKRAGLAPAVGVSVSSLYAYLNGTTLPATDSFDRLLDVLGVAPAERGRLATARDRLDERGLAGASPRPREIPADVFGFTGRDGELALLDRLLDGARPPVLLSGAAGVGKTALAIRWAHQVRDRFPDGQLYVDLRGYDPDRPVRPGDALEAFLRGLGVVGADIPYELTERAARYRSILAKRRMLVLLDNARAADQIADLLPGTPSCFVVVTSRDSLDDLVVQHDARRIELAPLPIADAITLLRNLIGARVDAEPIAAVTLAHLCARLPLALRIAAELAANQPAATLAELNNELRRRRLDLLDASGDPRTSVRAVFSWSYTSLSADAAHAFRLVGLHPGDDVAGNAVAALLDTDVDMARQLLDTLLRAHFVHQTGPDRYGMHDLLRGYAVEQASTGKESVNRAAITRLLDHYTSTAAAAADLLYPQHRDPHARVSAAEPDQRFLNPEQAAVWLDAEHRNLVSVAEYAAIHGWPASTIRLSHALARHLRVRSHYADALMVHSHALHASVRMGDRAGERGAQSRLGEIHLMMGRHDRAIEHLRRALAVARDTGDRAGEHNALANLGDVYRLVGRYKAALGDYRRALTIARDTADRNGERRALAGLGDVHAVLGRYKAARHHYQRALIIARDVGDRFGERNALANLGNTARLLGRYDQAIEQLGQALAIASRMGNRIGEGYALIGIGDVHRMLGRHDQAVDHYQQALAIFGQAGDRNGEFEALNGLGEALRETGHPEDAAAHHGAAVAIAREIGQRHDHARGLDGLARACRDLGLHHLARRHWEDALAIFAQLGTPEADEVRRQLATVSAGDGVL